MDRKKIFGDRLRAARMNAGLTQLELIEKMNDGLTQSLLSRYERGESTPRRDRMGRFSFVLDVSEAWLRGLERNDHKATASEKLSRLEVDVAEIGREFRLLDLLALHVSEDCRITDPAKTILRVKGIPDAELEGLSDSAAIEIARSVANKSSAAKAILTLFDMRSASYEEKSRRLYAAKKDYELDRVADNGD